MLLQPAQVPVHGVGHSAATLFLLQKELAKGNISHLPNSAISFKLPLGCGLVLLRSAMLAGRHVPVY